MQILPHQDMTFWGSTSFQHRSDVYKSGVKTQAQKGLTRIRRTSTILVLHGWAVICRKTPLHTSQFALPPCANYEVSTAVKELTTKVHTVINIISLPYHLDSVSFPEGQIALSLASKFIQSRYPETLSRWYPLGRRWRRRLYKRFRSQHFRNREAVGSKQRHESGIELRKHLLFFAAADTISEFEGKRSREK